MPRSPGPQSRIDRGNERLSFACTWSLCGSRRLAVVSHCAVLGYDGFPAELLAESAVPERAFVCSKRLVVPEAVGRAPLDAVLLTALFDPLWCSHVMPVMA